VPLELAVADAPRLRDRAAAWLRSRHLDLALAAGVSPEATPSLAIRARRLTRQSRRHLIAHSLRRAARAAGEGESPASARITPRLKQVGLAGEEVNRLAAVLSEPAPVAARGVAQAWLLVTDGTGPLYNPESRISLREKVAAATENLRPS
jgi:hypothetical protein